MERAEAFNRFMMLAFYAYCEANISLLLKYRVSKSIEASIVLKVKVVKID